MFESHNYQGGQLYSSVGLFWQFDPGDIYFNTPGIRPTFAHFDQKSAVFGTIITNLTENGANYASLAYKKAIHYILK